MELPAQGTMAVAIIFQLAQHFILDIAAGTTSGNHMALAPVTTLQTIHFSTAGLRA
jgi:hypothetical protein